MMVGNCWENAWRRKSASNADNVDVGDDGIKSDYNKKINKII